MTILDEVPRHDAMKRDAPETSKWLLLFYIAGDSMLSATMISQLKELTDAGFHKDATVLAYFDPNCNGRNARIFNINHLRKKKSKKRMMIGDNRDPYVRDLAEGTPVKGLPQMTASASLTYFLDQATTDFRAENYMLFLMGHGTIVGNDTFLPDPDDNSSITLKKLGEILKVFAGKIRGSGKANKKAAAGNSVNGEFHLVGLHSCAMSSVELAYELQGTARYMVATQGMAFPGSWPYRQILKEIYNKIEEHRKKSFGSKPYPNQLVGEILRGIQDLSFFNGEDFWQAGYSSDLSLCSLDSDKVKRLDQPLNDLVLALKAGIKGQGRTGILMAHWESQSYWNESYTDLYDFCDRLQTYCASDSGITGACRDVKRVLKAKPHDFGNLVVVSDYFGPNYQFSHGLSIYLPWVRPNQWTMKTYDRYEFTRSAKRHHRWADFLEDYFKYTKRAMRDPNDKAVRTKPVPPPPDKPPALSGRPAGKGNSPELAMPQPPDKPPSTGIAGQTIIKNYFDSEEIDITSRPPRVAKQKGKSKTT